MSQNNKVRPMRGSGNHGPRGPVKVNKDSLKILKTLLT
jgi:hypothetical protein